MRAPVFLALILVLQTGCATYQHKVGEARSHIASRNPAKAAELLKPLAEEESKDQLVYLLDYAIALHEEGKYKESAHALSEAEKIADIQDYTSLSKETASLILNEGMVQYKGDDYEKVLINAMNAINFVMLGNLESALVEVRRLNNKLHLYKTEAKRDYEQNPFAYYLSAIIWEADGKYDDAYIAYKKTYELQPGYEPLKEDLVRASIKAQREDDTAKWLRQFKDVKVRPEWKDKSLGELVVIYQQGWGPRKAPNPQSPRFPALYPQMTYTTRARVEVGPADNGSLVTDRVVNKTEDTKEIYNVTNVAIKTLDDQYAGLIAKRVAGIAAKAIVSDQIRQKNELLGAISWIAMNVADQADLRQWSTLPGALQISRIPLKAGKYNVGIKGLAVTGSETGEAMPPRPIEINAGQKAFLTWRSFR
jgi:uncharacterized protein